MIYRPRLAAEYAVGKGMAFADRHRGQLDAVGDVADRPDVVDIGAAVGADRNRMIVVQCDTGGSKAEVLDVRPATDRPQQHVGLDRVAVLDNQADARRGLLDAFDPAVEFELDALGQRDRQQAVAQGLIILAQDGVAAVDQRHLDPELVEHAGEFVGDIAAARDHQ